MPTVLVTTATSLSDAVNKINNAFTDASNLSSGTVPLAQLSGITNAQISNSAGITGGQMASATITSSNIASATITGSNIADGTITTAKMASNAITDATLGIVSYSSTGTYHGSCTSTVSSFGYSPNAHVSYAHYEQTKASCIDQCYGTTGEIWNCINTLFVFN